MTLYYVAIIVGILAIVIATLIQLQQQLKSLVKENEKLQHALNTANTALAQKVIAASNASNETDSSVAISTNETQTIIKKATAATSPTVSAIEEAPPILNNSLQQQYYYLVKELMVINKATSKVLSTELYTFIGDNLYKSKEAARLFYDEKRSSQFGKDGKTVLKYELYIVNNVFKDIKNINPVDEAPKDVTKKYLLIDDAGIEQSAGRNIESFALSAFASNSSKKGNNFSNRLSTGNSFLDGHYKD